LNLLRSIHLEHATTIVMATHDRHASSTLPAADLAAGRKA